MNDDSVPRPFWNDGGPLLIAPQAAVPWWEGGDPPSDGRVVHAEARASGHDVATDYDRACDIDPESAGALDVGESWGVVIGTAAAQSAFWLPGADPREFFAVGIEAADDTAPDRLRELAAAPGSWRVLRERLAVGPEGLLLAHAASRLTEVRERPATMPAAGGESEAALIGHGLRFAAPAGEYTVSARDVGTSSGEYLTFIRFAAAEPGA
jgi:hypothetical protein